ncbi:response regulator [Desulfuromonas thiophila]|uniref:hybrid sensor histidine kinase/response regulator n=1 Tax=Desulfuromonas thiophila TaxID=57664 RepID=UPI0029F5B8D8|nr:response regulator [Desulfuromonas thiophila]
MSDRSTSPAIPPQPAARPVPELAPWFYPLLAFCVMLISGLAAFGLVYNEVRLHQRQNLQQHLASIAQAAASLIDVERHERLRQPQQQDSADYRHALEPLVQLHLAFPDVAYLYSMVLRDGQAYYVLDTAMDARIQRQHPELIASEIMEPYQGTADDNTDWLTTLAAGRPYVDDRPYSDEYGTFWTACAPFFSADGAVAGFVGVDVKEEVLFHTRQHRLLLAEITLFYSGAMLLVSLWLTRLTRRQRRDHRRLQGYQQQLETLVTERSSQLREVSAQQQAIFHSAPVGIALLQQRQILACNSRLEQITGYSASTMIGQTTRLWYASSADFAAVGEMVRRSFAEQRIFCHEFQLRRPDGQRYWARLMGEALPDYADSGRLVAIVEDISEERRAAEELRDARDAAEAASQAKSTFVANMSHEIRTPMNAVLGMAHLALQTELSPKQRNYLEKIQSSGQHLLGGLNQILDFAKVESGQLQLEQAPFALRQLMREVVSLSQNRARQKGLSLRLDLAADLPDQLTGDALRIQQILLNYTDNAIKFSDRGEIVLQVRATAPTQKPAAEPAGSIELLFRVCDQGLGLTTEQQSRLFQRFSQADMSTTRTHGGTGPGLAICKQLAELMGGAVGVESQAGQGSCFWFSARLQQAAPAVTPEANAPATGPATATPALQGQLLLVEDNPINQEVARDLLEHLGLQVAVASNGREALAKLEQETYDLVLMDVQMPVLDGLEATRILRRDPRWRQLPVVALTASVLESDQNSCLAAGMNDHLAKPIEPAELEQLLRRWLPGDTSAPASP